MIVDERLPEELSFEEAMESLDTIVASLEGERLTLEQMVSSYERGMKLLRVCRARIERAQQRVESINMDLQGRGKATLSEFAPLETVETSPPSTPPGEAPKRIKKKIVQDEGIAEDEIRLF